MEHSAMSSHGQSNQTNRFVVRIPVGRCAEIIGDMYVPMKGHSNLSTNDHAVSPGGEIMTSSRSTTQSAPNANRLPKSIIVFANGTGSGRQNPIDLHVSSLLTNSGYATLLLDLLTPEEMVSGLDSLSLNHRLRKAMQWLKGRELGFSRIKLSPSMPINTRDMSVGIIASGQGAAAAIEIAASHGEQYEIRTIISICGKYGQVRDQLGEVVIPLLLVVASLDSDSLEENTAVFYKLIKLPTEYRQLDVIQAAHPALSDNGAMDTVAQHSLTWLKMHLPL